MKNNVSMIIIGMSIFINHFCIGMFPTVGLNEDTKRFLSELEPKIRISPDFKGIGEELAKAITSSTGEVARTLQSKEIQENASNLGRGVSSFAGNAARGFRYGVENQIAPEFDLIFQRLFATSFNYRNALQIGLPTALIGLLSVSGTLGTTVMWKKIEQMLLNPKPKILLDSAKYGRWDRITRWRQSYQTPPMIFDQSVQERLSEIEEVTNNIKNQIKNGSNITYNNLLLYGRPGTGKTLFAQILADKTNMDFLPVTAASLLQSGASSIKNIDDLISMANKSSYGTIIFIDEADALFVDREQLNPDLNHYKLLNHILALTGQGNNKFMLIAATNHAQKLDSAMGRRFQDRVLMPLPDAITRKLLIELYLNRFIFNEKEHNAQFIKTAQQLFSASAIDGIISQTEGMSHAEIKDLIDAIHKKALSSKDGMITAQHINRAVEQAVEKHQVLEQEIQEKERKQNTASIPRNT